MKALKITIGSKFNDYEVICEPYHNSKGFRVVKCRCKCGNIKEIYCCTLRKVKRCTLCNGKLCRKFNIGDKYNRLIVIDYVYFPGRNNSKVKVKCECGDEYLMRSHELKTTKCCKKCHRRKSGKEHSSYKGLEFISKTYYTVAKHNAKNKKREFSISIEYLNNLLIIQNHKCKLSGLPIKIGNAVEETTASLDRIDSSKGYTENNIQWVHKDINHMKSDFKQSRFQELCKLVAKNTEL